MQPSIYTLMSAVWQPLNGILFEQTPRRCIGKQWSVEVAAKGQSIMVYLPAVLD